MELFNLPIDRMDSEDVLHVVHYLECVNDSKECEDERRMLMDTLGPYLSARLSATNHTQAITMLLYGQILSNVFEIQVRGNLAMSGALLLLENFRRSSGCIVQSFCLQMNK